MKLSVFTQILSIAALTLSSTASITQPSHAQTSKFFCGMSRGVPATLVRTSRGNIPIIRWVDEAFPPPWTPEKRCEEISSRFQRFYDNGTLNFLRAGKLRSQPVLCVASEKNGPCLANGVLVTLKPDRNPRETLQRLLDYRGGSGGVSIDLSGFGTNNNNNSAVVTGGDDTAYVDVKKWINEAESSKSGEFCPVGKPAWQC
ncbi:hypothetical protein CEN50_02630 [Fischerella thermalis CCMEE 5268]|uniref:Uncharacterized protein n=1 Tax=Fischerella thermalis CCMEE 5268 TaxID=2019662 RepID=A0A2N6KLA8_9CYAN|nr:COP23 domain-containing protein [Fischerella thermalis]PMB00582.1 hypothetical protein CEN50_02630 [Fischerella thermalis CCMEE 5268]